MSHRNRSYTILLSCSLGHKQICHSVYTLDVMRDTFVSWKDGNIPIKSGVVWFPASNCL